MSKEEKLRWEGFVEKVGFEFLSLEWKSEGLGDESGDVDDDRDGLRCEIDESRQD